ncbi:hypothetical protein FRB97_003883 [Tulasnella sp. 331]|nr:hypothetical protein FRB97_003883 [Tulasnella sp. 331]
MLGLCSTIVLTLSAFSLAAPILRDGHRQVDYQNNNRRDPAWTPCNQLLQKAIPIETTIDAWRQQMVTVNCLRPNDTTTQPIADQCSTLRATWIVRARHESPDDPYMQGVAQQIASLGCTDGRPSVLSQAGCEQVNRQMTLLLWYEQTKQSALSNRGMQAAWDALNTRAGKIQGCALTGTT